jgi:ferredoxin
MKARLIGLALILIGVGLAGGTGASIFACGSGIAIAVIGIMLLLWAPPGTLFRLDHFLPFVNRRWQPAVYPGRLGSLGRRFLPPSWFFDPATGKQGHARRILRRLGTSVVSSPGRRIIQGICFVVFFTLFFHVCWPYSAQPKPMGAVSTEWHLDHLDEVTGAIHFKGGQLPSTHHESGQIFVVDPLAFVVAEGLAGEFRIEAVADTGISLQPVGELAPDQFDKFLLGSGTWNFHEDRPDQWPSHYTDDLARKEIIAAELFLILDPLVSISTAIASGSWIWSLGCAGVILLVCVLIPRGFCGYLCPLGTLIDLFDWAIGKRVKRFRVPGEGWWVHIKYYLLLGTLICSLFGILVSGFVAAIPVITRGFLFLGEPLQTGFLRGWHLVPAMNTGHWLSIALFGGILGLGFLRPRFWCKYVCPSGAVFSVANLFRISERKVEESCINCNKCVEVCPFDAIKPDFTTRESDCTLCQTCGGVCPSHSIKFVDRWNTTDLKIAPPLAPGESPIGRRGFMALWTGLTTAIVGSAVVTTTTKLWGRNQVTGLPPVRPPGSIPEPDFLQACIRCGECFKACPNNVLQSQGFDQGFDGLWTPVVNADWAGCESSCNACGQVCPTGAIRALPLAEKKSVRMGLAIVNETTCLPFADREACQLCVDECDAAGYGAIEFTRVHTQTDLLGNPLEDTGFVAPVVLANKCVGCGLCQTRCHGINVEEKGLLQKSAIIIEAGPGKEDRSW